jgi:hypothetical protein
MAYAPTPSSGLVLNGIMRWPTAGALAVTAVTAVAVIEPSAIVAQVETPTPAPQAPVVLKQIAG